MKALVKSLVAAALVPLFAIQDAPPRQQAESMQKMELGAFSISLAVKDLSASRAFYEKLGFEEIGGEAEENWLILRNGSSVIGLFQGMFEENILTFNPGWTTEQEHLLEFDDVRDIQRALEAHGLELKTRADEASTGPASLVLMDPDGNAILIDQHVPRPEAR